MRDFIIMTVTLYCIWYVIHGIAGKGDRKDRNRWPYLMKREDDFREHAKKFKHSSLGHDLQKSANEMRRLRKLARKKEALAKYLDVNEQSAKKAYIKNLPLRQALEDESYMQWQINDMQQKIRDLEFKGQYRY